ncbi:Acetyl-CoA biotin carboxyl carrier [Rosistilla carotiformis]|uniref:Biotin carboxyl carrier protein of acetyl-CoA carboxylase n=1 Tax=Rosistilla carotiformis TaxID=2528017 RepID=A0A518JWB3_9BACT|nr:acetyl-CoA carboxylase biotin carboxyl carrier protein [Rosistilla carotiformis]QDV69824.1 Acetyl-CoA biotin carboxyl carrier [Rosistilla carotiformis]
MSGDVFDIEQIRKLVELMEEHNLAEVDLKQDQKEIKLCRGGFAAAPAPMMMAPAAAPAAPAAAAAAPATDGANIAIIKAPMVGTFYARANPEAAPFVKVGDSVNADTTICIVEAMKVFNEIPAEISGKVVAVLAKDGEAVDFGKPLFKIDTSA